MTAILHGGASSSAPQDPQPFLFFVALVLAFQVVEFVRERRRSRLMQAFARREELAWLDKKLPQGFPTEMLEHLDTWVPWLWGSNVSHAVGGVFRGDYRLAFDLELRSFRSRRTITVVALRSTRSRLPPLDHDAYEASESGPWRMVTYWGRTDRGKMAPELIQQIWEALT